MTQNLKAKPSSKLYGTTAHLLYCNGEHDLMLLSSLVCDPAAVSPWVMEQEMMLQGEVCTAAAGVKNQWAPVHNGIDPVGVLCVCGCVCVRVHARNTVRHKCHIRWLKKQSDALLVCVSWWKMMAGKECTLSFAVEESAQWLTDWLSSLLVPPEV